MQCLGQTDLAGEPQLDQPTSPFPARAGAGALQDANLYPRRRNAEKGEQGEDGGAEGVDGGVTGLGGGRDDAGPDEADVHVRLREGGEEAEGHEVVGDAPRAADGEVVLDDVPLGGAEAGHGARDEARVVRHGGAGVGDLHGAAVGDGLEEPQEGDLMVRQARVRRRGAADLGDVDGAAGEGGQSQALREAAVARETEEVGLRVGHGD